MSETFFHPVDTSKTSANAIEESLHAKAIYEAIQRIRKVQKKRPHSGNIISAASKSSGLPEKELSNTLEKLVESGSVFISETSRGEDSYFLYDQDQFDMDSNLANGTSTTTNISVESMLGDLTHTPIIAESPVYHTPGERWKTEFFAFLDIIQGLTNDIRSLQAKVSELSSKNEKLLIDNYDLKLENIRLKFNSTYSSSRDTPCGESMPRGMAGKTMIKQRDLLKETKDFSSCKFILSEGESVVHEKTETSETSGNLMLQHKNTKASSNIKKRNAPTNSKVKQSMQGDGKATSLPNGEASLTKPSSVNKGNNSSDNNKDTNSVKKIGMNYCDGAQSNSQSNENGKWRKNTVLIVGDSMLSNINERTLSRKYTIKVRSFPGATVSDMFDYLKPLLKKEPEKILLLIGANDVEHKTAALILAEIKSLIDFIQEHIPTCHVVVSEIIQRLDKKYLNGKIIEVNKALKSMNCDTLPQQNITSDLLGKRGFHLNFFGNKKLATNIIDKLRSFSF